MPGWLDRLLHHHREHAEAPPAWSTAPEQSHAYGLHEDATADSFAAGAAFCARFPADAPRLLPADAVEHARAQGCAAWGLCAPRTRNFVGRVGPSPGDARQGGGVVEVETQDGCDDACLLSDLPIMAGLYESAGKEGVYYEIEVVEMAGTVAIGTACRPYPEFRLPGWNRLSMALHLDDLRKFCEDSDGGQDYDFPTVQPGDTVGCGLSFGSAQLFFTHNGVRAAPAFAGLYVPRADFDVYAAVGVCGRSRLRVNFGGAPFRWKEGNGWAWRVEGHVGRLAGGPGGEAEGLPSYAQASNT